MRSEVWTSLAVGVVAVLGLDVTLPTASDAKGNAVNKKKDCAVAETTFQATVQATWMATT